jgi:hypothetical protein
MISVLALSAADSGFEPGRIKPKTIKLVIVASPLSMSIWVFFSAILWQEQVTFQWLWSLLVLDQHTSSWNFIVLTYWNNSPQVDMSLHLDTLFWFRANQSLLFLLNAHQQFTLSLMINWWSDILYLSVVNIPGQNWQEFFNLGLDFTDSFLVIIF